MKTTPLLLSEEHFDFAEVVAPLAEPPVNEVRSLSPLHPPPLHQTGQMKRLSTPWPVCLTRAEQLAERQLADGVILDPACGSGMQLYAYCARLRRIGLGIELDSDAALLAAANGRRVVDAHGGGWDEHSRVILGDGTDAAAALAASGLTNRQIAVLHLDPARPRDSQRHSLDEMQPPLQDILDAWEPYLAEGRQGPAIILDLSPRLSSAQRQEVEQVLNTRWPSRPLTWEFVSTGSGRVDRLTVWFGSAADPRCEVRMLRLLPNGNVCTLRGHNQRPESQVGESPKIGDWLTIVDSALLSSGLHEEWVAKAVPRRSEARWLRAEGRRPLLLTSTPLNYDDPVVEAMVSTTGEVVAKAKQPPTESGIEAIIVSARSSYLSRLTLRCNMNPADQPVIQSALDKGLRSHHRGRPGFLADAPTSQGTAWLLCIEKRNNISE